MNLVQMLIRRFGAMSSGIHMDSMFSMNWMPFFGRLKGGGVRTFQTDRDGLQRTRSLHGVWP
jgi:hypothetical protein